MGNSWELPTLTHESPKKFGEIPWMPVQGATTACTRKRENQPASCASAGMDTMVGPQSPSLEKEMGKT